MKLRKLSETKPSKRPEKRGGDKDAEGAAMPCPSVYDESDTTRMRFLAPILSSTKDLFYVWDREKRFVVANSNFENLWGLERDGFKGKTHAELGYPRELCETIGRRIEQVFVTKDPATGEAGYDSPAGGPMYWEYTFYPIIGSDGDVEFVAGVSRNITERKMAEAALKESEEKYRRLFNLMDQGFFLVDVIFDEYDRPVDMYFAEANAAATSMLGRDFTGKRLREIDPNYEEYWYEIFGQVARTGESVRMERYAEPDKMWVDFFAFKVGGPESRRVGNIFMDITARRAMERELAEYRDNLERLVEERTAELRRSERHYRTLLESVPMIITRFDTEFRFRYISPQEEADLGYDSKQVIGKNWEEIGLPEAVYRPWREKFREALETGRAVEYEARYPSKYGGEIRDFLVQVIPETDEAGQVESLLTVAQDVTARNKGLRRQHTELAAIRSLYELGIRQVSQDNLEDVLGEILDTAINMSHADMGNIQLLEPESGALKIQAHRGFQQPFLDYFVSVYPEIGGCGASCGAAFARKQRVIVEDVCKSAIFTGTPALDVMLAAGARGVQSTPLVSREGKLVGMLNTHYHQPGIVDEFDLRFIDLLAGQAADIIVQVQTQNQLREKEAELLRLDRLNTVGEMAAAIGHEVRNPLTAVRGYLQMFMRKKESARFQGQFRTMIEELDRANNIISEFLSLAKNKAVELKQYSLNDVISALLPLLQSEAYRIGQDIQVEMDDVPDICMDDKEIRQMLLNLTRNAFEAMREGGKLTIRTERENDRVVLAVSDTGDGIPEEVLAKLGTPFVTTKESGTGLGLAVCYRIAERHGAKIEVTTSPQGTTFVVRFKV